LCIGKKVKETEKRVIVMGMAMAIGMGMGMVMEVGKDDRDFLGFG